MGWIASDCICKSLNVCRDICHRPFCSFRIQDKRATGNSAARCISHLRICAESMRWVLFLLRGYWGRHRFPMCNQASNRGNYTVPSAKTWMSAETFMMIFSSLPKRGIERWLQESISLRTLIFTMLLTVLAAMTSLSVWVICLKKSNHQNSLQNILKLRFLRIFWTKTVVSFSWYMRNWLKLSNFGGKICLKLQRKYFCILCSFAKNRPHSKNL